ncbi:MAG: uncharacterized protein JWL84_3274, partial [Rhodospirillales bacterium]|nr:uncharacterized protein [Rhodospirillales bacterium]
SVLGPFIPYSFLAPEVGVLLWCWISFGSSHQLVSGFLAGKPTNLIVALASLCGLVFPKAPKSLPGNHVAILIFMAWITITSYFGISDQSKLELLEPI